MSLDIVRRRIGVPVELRGDPRLAHTQLLCDLRYRQPLPGQVCDVGCEVVHFANVPRGHPPETVPFASLGRRVGACDMNAKQRALWAVAVMLIIATVLGFLLLGILGMMIAVPALVFIWLAATASAGGPAAGA
ncbi:MAG: hypothetical protein QOJ13_1186 [Gaiellales bacterium]|nr:hypothetical protein [Gaiellales bacterium]